MLRRPNFWRGGGVLLTVIFGALALAMVGCGHQDPGDPGVSVIKGGYTSGRAVRLEHSLSPAMLVLAGRLDSQAHTDLGGRPEGWDVLDLATPPSLNLGPLSPAEAKLINALVPGQHEVAAPVSPFRLNARGAERERALECMTQAIYYEAALEPTEGQQAVAQVILNRVHHPLFPKSVCGVVYQGSSQSTGCQFSFTCDGSMARAPAPTYWRRAGEVAENALAGFVMRDIGTATHYHADYVFPRWGPTMVKIGQIGAHIFYRFPGPMGQSESLRERYSGGELHVSRAGPSAADLAAARAHYDPNLPTVTILDPTAPGGYRTRRPGEVEFGRRVPSRSEIDRINEALAAVDKKVPSL